MSFYLQVTPSTGSMSSFSTGLCSLLFIRSDQPRCTVYPPLRPYLHITLLLSVRCVLGFLSFLFFFEAWFGWWDVAAIQRAFYFSLLALKQRGGGGGVQAAGLRASEKRLRDDGRGKEEKRRSLFFRARLFRLWEHCWLFMISHIATQNINSPLFKACWSFSYLHFFHVKNATYQIWQG